MRFNNPITTAILLIVFFAQSTIFVYGREFTDIETQALQFTHISVNEGLSQSTVLSCCQDSIGHMWFATHDGLNRYDGYEFHIYRHNSEYSTSISDNTIRKVYAGTGGRIWVGTESGLSLYEIDNDSFRNFPTDYKAVTGIAEIPENGSLMVAYGGGLHFFCTDKMEWEHSSSPYQKDSFGATILYRQDDNVWIGTQQDGLFCYNILSAEIKKISSFTSRFSIQCILSHKNALWVATEGDGLYRIDDKTGETINYRHFNYDRTGISSNYVRTLSADSEGRLWIGTFNGLSILDRGGFINLKGDQLSQGSLSQPSVRCITRDNQGGMWLGTWYGGVNYWHPLKHRFTNIQRNISVNSLNDNIVSCIAEDSDGSLWIGTKSGGLNHYEPGTGKFSYYSLQKSPHNEKIESNDIKAIHIDGETGNIYFGVHAGGVNLIDKRSGSIIHYPHGRNNAPLDVYSILPADRGRLWVGTLNGLKLFNKVTRTYEDVNEDCNGMPLKELKIKYMLKDSRDRIWVGGQNGMDCFSITPEGLLPYRPAILEDIFNSAYVNSIFESSTKQIWTATSNGLICYDEQENRLIRYRAFDGLPSDVVYGIEEDSFGRLWISTDNGLSCFNPFSGGFKNFTIADGIQSNQFNLNSHCKRKNGEILFGGINGITAFNPENMTDNPYAPAPQITGLSIANKEVRINDEDGILERNILTTEQITLKHNQNSITVEVSVPNYVSCQHNSFSFRLEGIDKEWQTSKTREISYSNLPHGRYRLLIKAGNNDDKWNDEPRILNIRIKPVWYKTILAKIIFILLITAMIIGTFVIIVERKEKESRLELEKQEKAHQEDIHQMKMRFFINISHEMRTPLTLITNPLSEMIAKSDDRWMNKQLKYVERNVKRLLHLVNQLMDYRRAELGVFRLKVRPENVHKIVKENWSFYEKLAESKKIRYSLNSELEGQSYHIDGQYLELILNNLLSNAFKYTDSGNISVNAREKGGNIIIEVSDTGTGIPAGQQDKIFERFYQIDHEHIGSGIGLSLVQRLVELHHGTIRLDSEEGKGSTFQVTLPGTPQSYGLEELDTTSGNDTYTSSAYGMYIPDSEEQEDEHITDSNTKKGRILIAEDDEDIRTYMKNGLSGMFDIVLAKNGEEAVRMMKESEPDIVITDMMMPVMDGLKLCSYVKQNIQTSHIPVIMLSAKTESKDLLKALKAGADDYIAKPFSMSILIAKTQNILRTQHRLHEKVTKSMEISPEKVSFNAMDEEILNKAIAIVQKNIDNTGFSTEEFASAMNMSRSNLHIKLKALTGESALDFIRKIRFKEACRLLKDGRYSVSEISDMVGFNTPSYFATCFKKYMGCLPTEYQKNGLTKENV